MPENSSDLYDQGEKTESNYKTHLSPFSVTITEHLSLNNYKKLKFMLGHNSGGWEGQDHRAAEGLVLLQFMVESRKASGLMQMRQNRRQP